MDGDLAALEPPAGDGAGAVRFTVVIKTTERRWVTTPQSGEVGVGLRRLQARRQERDPTYAGHWSLCNSSVTKTAEGFNLFNRPEDVHHCREERPSTHTQNAKIWIRKRISEGVPEQHTGTLLGRIAGSTAGARWASRRRKRQHQLGPPSISEHCTGRSGAYSERPTCVRDAEGNESSAAALAGKDDFGRARRRMRERDAASTQGSAIEVIASRGRSSQKKHRPGLQPFPSPRSTALSSTGGGLSAHARRPTKRKNPRTCDIHCWTDNPPYSERRRFVASHFELNAEGWSVRASEVKDDGDWGAFSPESLSKLKDTARAKLAAPNEDTPPPRRVWWSFVEVEDPGTHAHWAEHVHARHVHASARPHIEQGLLKPNGSQAGSHGRSDGLLVLHRRRCRPSLECSELQARADTKAESRASATAVGGESEIGWDRDGTRSVSTVGLSAPKLASAWGRCCRAGE
ncbi:hypothetical protein LXA43DRAFT_1062900 [Ganoderma leucocontextum]|nr:hypothetical protein LXA43DRAFT_1062900 [Ganoderma leucocontextum]